MKKLTFNASLFSTLLLLYALFGAINLNAQQVRLYVCMNDLNATNLKFLKSNNIAQVALFDGRYLDPHNTLTVDVNALTNAIIKQFPAASSHGMAALDWEGDILANLQKDPESDEFKKALSSFEQAFFLAKKLRPNVKWGYYGFPFTVYWNRRTKLGSLNMPIMKLLKEMDVFFPSLYISYKDGSISANDNEQYAAENTLVVLKIAKNLGKPVLPFIWHRYHVSNNTIALQLVPMPEFSRFVNQITTVSYQGTRISGLVWWGADSYYYNIKSKALVDEVNNFNNGGFTAYHDSIISAYGKLLLKRVSTTN